MHGFWDKIIRPIIVQAPMADVTDPAFRLIIAKYGKPDVLWTEQVSCDGLLHKEGREHLLADLRFSERERPIVAQFFGATPAHFYVCAQLVQELGFDGIDINMGCPDRNINKQKAGACLINDPELAEAIIRETKRGAGNLPVSVKTRIGYGHISLENWLPYLLEAEPALITLHARTRKELSLVPAHWDVVRRAKEIITERKYPTLLLGNGDIKTVEEAFKRVEETGADGVMIGRAIFGNLWLYVNLKKQKEIYIDRTLGVLQKDTECPLKIRPTAQERLRVLLEHAQLFDELVRPYKSFAVMRKHFGSYITGFTGAKELRLKMMSANSAEELETILKQAGMLET